MKNIAAALILAASTFEENSGRGPGMKPVSPEPDRRRKLQLRAFAPARDRFLLPPPNYLVKMNFFG